MLGDAAYDPTITAETVAARDGWAEMTAVVDGRVVPLPEDILITRPGPRIIDGLEALARAIHPERVRLMRAATAQRGDAARSRSA